MRLARRLNFRGFAGAPIDVWNRRVRLVYLDEAGISNPDDEPYLVVAGVIVNADQDWRPLDQHLKSICRRYLPNYDDFGEEFIFHAKDIWQGRRYWHHPSWTLEKRRAVLLELAQIPSRFHLPVVYSAIERKLAHAAILRVNQSIQPSEDTTRLVHAEAFVNVVGTVDAWIGANAPREVAMLVIEDSGKVKGTLKLIHAGYRRDPIAADVFTTKNIVDTVHFAAKEESQLLQIADTCAFIIKRWVATQRQDVQIFFDALRPQLVSPGGRDGRPLQLRVPVSQLKLVR